MRYLAILLLVLTGCRSGVGIGLGNFWAAGQFTIADVRNSEASIAIDEQGLELWVEKDPASKQFMGMVERTVPVTMKAVVAGLIGKGILDAATTVADLFSEEEVKTITQDVASEVVP